VQARISIAPAAVKLLRTQLAQVRVRGDQQFCERLGAMLLFAQQQTVIETAHLLGQPLRRIQKKRLAAGMSTLIDFKEDLVQVPFIAKPRPPTAQLGSIGLSEFQVPRAECFVSNDDAVRREALRHHGSGASSGSSARRRG
jgi:hypothetical protein